MAVRRVYRMQWTSATVAAAATADLVVDRLVVKDLMVYLVIQLVIVAIMMMHRLVVRVEVNVVQVMNGGRRRWRIDRHERRVEELVKIVVVRRLISSFVREERMQIEIELVAGCAVQLIAVHWWLVHWRRRRWWRHIVVVAIKAVLAAIVVEVRIQIIVVIVRRVVLAIVERSGGVLFASISEK